MNVAGEHGHDYAPLRLTELIVKGYADLLFADGVTRTLHIGRFTQQRQHAAFAQLREGSQIGHMPIHGRIVHFEIAGNHHRARRAGQRNGTCARNGVAHMNELRREIFADAHLVPRRNHLHRNSGNAVFLQLQVHQRQRQLRAVKRRGNLLQNVRRCANVILMAVRQQISPHILFLSDQIGYVRDDQVDAQHILLGENGPAVHHHNIVLVFKDGHVLANLVHAAQRDDTQLAYRGICLSHREPPFKRSGKIKILLSHQRRDASAPGAKSQSIGYSRKRRVCISTEARRLQKAPRATATAC